MNGAMSPSDLSVPQTDALIDHEQAALPRDPRRDSPAQEHHRARDRCDRCGATKANADRLKLED